MSMRKIRENRLIPHGVDIKLPPIEVARRLRHLPGFLFFDTVNRSSGLSVKGGVSIIAAMPDQVLSGHIDEKLFNMLLRNGFQYC